MRHCYKLLLLILLVSVHHVAVATTTVNDRNISPLQWRQVATNKEFTYVQEVEKIKGEPKKPKVDVDNSAKKSFIKKVLIAIVEILAGPVGKILAWGTMLAIVGYILYRILGSGEALLFAKRQKKVKQGAATHTPTFGETDWEELLQKAVQANDVRLAVRYSYMLLLQLLQQRQMIDYRDDKTNYEYYRELERTPYKQPFKTISRQYEYAWYGNYALSVSAYNDYITLFNEVRQKLA